MLKSYYYQHRYQAWLQTCYRTHPRYTFTSRDLSAKETGTRALVGKEAQTLTVAKYGASEWWLMLDPA